MNILTSSTPGAQLFGLAAFLGTIYAFTTFAITWPTVLLILAGYFAYTCLGIVVTFHRLHTHQSYEVNPWLAKLFSLLGCFAGTGSPLAWVTLHITHHLNSDKPGDPHSPHHEGWKLFTYQYTGKADASMRWRIRHLVTDKFQQFLHRDYFGVVLGWSALLFLVGGPYLMLFGHWVPALGTMLMSNIVNYLGHIPTLPGSYRTYNINDKSANNFWLSLVSFGEAFHNNHHRWPKRYTYSEKWWEIDISGLVIKLIKR